MRSMSFQRMLVSEMGQKCLQLVAAFPGWRMGIMTEFFQILGRLPEHLEVLKMLSRCLLAFFSKRVIIWPKIRSGLGVFIWIEAFDRRLKFRNSKV
ncbi:hypothetical protein TNCT_33501 [Trichonephila clavata]|uniref:Uncharacterized protein n=1 Tax=Trichonephila clavata TaxID=2740835 RepID=A0A8X6HYJ8_TRICU|nr:hypothetical protein TNCT_33501 [Trichonephila clavata]